MKEEKTSGKDHEKVWDLINALGWKLTEQGKLDEAEQMYRRALEGRERTLGAGHPSTLESCNHLGFLLTKQGKLEGAQIFIP